MAAQIRVIVLLIVALSSFTVCTPQDLNAAGVRDIIAQTPAADFWHLQELPPMDLASHVAVALGGNSQRIVILCIEGSMNRIHQLSPDDSRLSELQVERNTNKCLHASAVYFFQCKPLDSIFLQATSLVILNYHDLWYCRNNLRGQPQEDCPFVQINPNGATCQPGNTVLRQILEGEMNAVQNVGTINIVDMLTGLSHGEYKLPVSVADFALVGYENSNLVLAKLPKNQSEELHEKSSQPAPKENLYVHQKANSKLQDDNGCPYRQLAVVDLNTKALRMIQPLLDGATMGFSSIVRLQGRYLWWEYYPSEKKQNGVWVLRAMEKEKKPRIVLALRKVERDFSRWDGQQWINEGLEDDAIPSVSVVSDGQDGVVSLNGKLFLLVPTKDTKDSS